MKRPHPADLAQEAFIAKAERFEISLFLGPGHFAHASAATLAEVPGEAHRLKAENPSSRLPMVYAIAGDRSAFVKPEIWKGKTDG